jgi:tRNA threonylcarbamoyladenosine modification (KEOPS) complex Cgi121 subunit
MNNSRKYTVQQISEALRQAGSKHGASVLLSCDRKTIDRYLLEFPELNEAFIEAKETMVDIAQDSLLAMLQDKDCKGHSSACFFTLTTLGKHRGYSKHVVYEEKKTLTLEHDQMSNAELMEIINATPKPPCSALRRPGE